MVGLSVQKLGNLILVQLKLKNLCVARLSIVQAGELIPRLKAQVGFNRLELLDRELIPCLTNS